MTTVNDIKPLPTPSRIKLTPPEGNKVIEDQLRSAGLLNEEVSRANFGAFYDSKRAELKASRCDFIIDCPEADPPKFVLQGKTQGQGKHWLKEVQAAVEDPEQVKFWIDFYKTKGIDFFSSEVKEDFEQSKQSKNDDNSSVKYKEENSSKAESTIQTKPEESANSAATGESVQTA